MGQVQPGDCTGSCYPIGVRLTLQNILTRPRVLLFETSRVLLGDRVPRGLMLVIVNSSNSFEALAVRLTTRGSVAVAAGDTTRPH